MTVKFTGPAFAMVISLTALILAGCGQVPYEVATPKSVNRQLALEQKLETAPPRRAISLCYGRAINTPEEVLAQAEMICGSGQVKFLKSDAFWTPCSLQQPARATFICTPAP